MNRLFRALSLVACVAALPCCFASINAVAAPTIIGDWESGTREGWIDWNGGSPTTSVGPPRFAFNSVGATHGTGAIQFNEAGNYTQYLAIKLQNDPNDALSNHVADYTPAFLANTKLAFDMTLVQSEQTAGNFYANLGMFVNSNTFGFTRIGNLNNSNAPESVTTVTGDATTYYNGDNSFNPANVVGTQTSTWTYDIGFLHDGDTSNGEIVAGNYIELIFEAYTGGAAVWHIDNVRLFTPVVPVQGDYNQNGIVNAADYTTWRDHLGEAFTLPNRDPTNSGNVNQQDYTFWKGRFGAISGAGALSGGAAAPEPASWLLGLLAVCGLAGILRRF
jgi:hypothetical protein